MCRLHPFSKIKKSLEMYAHKEKPKKNESRAVSNSVAQKKSNVRHGFGFLDNRQKAVVQQKSAGMMESAILQRMPDENLENAYDLLVGALKNPIESSAFQQLLERIDQECDCIVEEEEIGHDEFGTWFVIEVESGSTHHLMQYEVIKTSEKFAQEMADDTKPPEARETRDQGVRIIFGRGTSFEYDPPDEDDEIKSMLKEQCTHYIHADSRAFGANQPGDYSVDINTNVDPNVLGSITDIETFEKLAVFLRWTGSKIRFIGIEYVPASVWESSEARKTTRDGLAMLKKYSNDNVPVVTKPDSIMSVIYSD